MSIYPPYMNPPYMTPIPPKDPRLAQMRALASAPLYTPQMATIPEQKNWQDQFELQKPQPPAISSFRLATGLLSKQQIKEIHESGKLPPNGVIYQKENGKYKIGLKHFHKESSSELPDGYFIKRNWLGFAKVKSAANSTDNENDIKHVSSYIPGSTPVYDPYYSPDYDTNYIESVNSPYNTYRPETNRPYL